MSPQKRRAKRQLEELLWEKNHPGGSLNPERAKGAIPRMFRHVPAGNTPRICDAAPWSPKPRTPVGAGGKLLQAQRNSVKKEIKKEQLEVLRAR